MFTPVRSCVFGYMCVHMQMKARDQCEVSSSLDLYLKF